MKYWIYWSANGGKEDRCDEPFDTREEAAAEIKAMKAEDVEAEEEGVWKYRIEEKEDDEEERSREDVDGGLECGDYPDSRSVVCAMAGGGLVVKRFASGYAREMWEIGMRERDFC